MGLRRTEVVFHFAIFFFYGYGECVMLSALDGVHNKLGRPADDPEIQRWLRGGPAYFTVWNLALHQVYFGLCCLSHLADWFPKFLPATLIKFADGVRRDIISSIFVSSSMMTAIHYWGMSYISPESVFTHFIRRAYPAWIDHLLHTYVVPAALFELYLRASSGGTLEMGKRRGWMIINVYITLYTVATAVCLGITGTWPYPFYDFFNNWMMALITIFVYSSAWFYYYAATQFAKVVWRNRKMRERVIPLKTKDKRA